MNPLIALLAVGITFAALFGAGWLACRRMTDLYTGLFRGPELGWPRGVQEEEPVDWNWDPAPDAHREPAAPEAVIPTSRLSPSVGRGLARRARW